MEVTSENEEKELLEADVIYLLMKKGFPISRNVRAQWMLEHLDTIVTIQHPSIENEETPELEIASIIPKDYSSSWSPKNNYQYNYKVTSSTTIIFLAYKYRMVFSLDMGPSLATIDIQHGEVVIDEVYLSIKRCLKSITRPFTIPGSDRIMQPEIYVTVIAHTPFFTNPAQQVLVQGWLVTADNVAYLLQFIEQQLSCLEEKVALATNIANQQLETLRAESEQLVGGLFEEGGTCFGTNNSSSIANICMVSPESSFVNMLRYGMLALALLPEHSCAHLVVITDGIVGVADVHVLDSVVQQLRATTVACSFLHVGSTYHPHCAEGLVPYQDLLRFLAAATLGSYMTYVSRDITACGTEMNIYHKSFLCWQLYRSESNDSLNTEEFTHEWISENFLFQGHQTPYLLRKKQVDDKVTCTLSNLLCCRLREGYLIKKASLREGSLELCFVLYWMSHVFLEYLVSCPWPLKSLAASTIIQYVVTIEAPYEFLHDITCLSKKPLKSQYRQGVVSRFWAALSSLTESDNMLAHFSWFPGSGWSWYSVPDTVRNGMPVFYLPTYPSAHTVQLSDAACPQFGQIWQPVVSMDPHQWARWMHTQRITLILSHDKPLPRHLHRANQSGRFQCIQCRQAAAALYAMLKNWATFVLVENHTYVQFIYREVDKPPVSFSLIRINCKALCVVLHIAFAGGTEGAVRHNVVIDLLERLSKLTLPSRPTEQRETPCCIIVHKALEKVLIRYERMPNDLSTVVFPDGTQPVAVRTPPLPGGSLTTTLSRYLYHSRWLWLVRRPFVQSTPGITLPRLNITAIARILSTITKIRLAEGFNFAYSAAGIINMVLEVQMQGLGSDTPSHPCIIQYILFPPHTIANPTLEQDSGSDDDTDEGTADGEGYTEDNESSGDFQIVTEAWIEPQCGRVVIPSHQSAAYMNALQYYQLPDAIAQIDEECINALLTLEYLSLLSQEVSNEKNNILSGQQCSGIQMNPGNGGTVGRSIKRPASTDFCDGPPDTDERIHSVLFAFDTLNILSKCQQAELLFSMFADGAGYVDDGRESANRVLIEGLIEHLKRIHNNELIFTPTDSQRFTEMLKHRLRDQGAAPVFLSRTGTEEQIEEANSGPQWRCFVKGISVTHVIITILPATEKDVRLIVFPDDGNKGGFNDIHCTTQCESLTSNPDFGERNLTPVPSMRSPKESESLLTLHVGDIESNISSRSTTAQSTPKLDVHRNVAASKGSKHGSILPVYVYDCSLALLIDVLVDKLPSPRAKDIYQDHTFRMGEQLGEEFINLKPGGDTKPSSPEPKSEDSDNAFNDQRSLMEHCKLLNLAHCHSYVVAVYKSLALQLPLSYEDMEATVDQCEESMIEINITNYLRSVCRHLSCSKNNSGNYLDRPACSNIQPLHNLIKNKFERIITVAFRPVPAHPEFYYCSPSWSSERLEQRCSQRSDSDDELGFTFHSDILDCKMDGIIGKVNQVSNATWPSTTHHDGVKLSSFASTESLSCDLQDDGSSYKEQPLFLQLSCSIHYRSSLSSTPVKLLPTCLMEIIENSEEMYDRDWSDLKVTLDIICLNLPKEVLEVSTDTHPGLRTTSYCSASPLGSTRTESEGSPGNDTQLSETEPIFEKIPHLSLYQRNAVNNLNEEIEWLLKDETATALLDQSIVTEETLRFVARHVSESNNRSSCFKDKVPFRFVFSSENSVPKFLDELKKLKIDRYCIKEEGSLFYFVKNEEKVSSSLEVETSKKDSVEHDVEEDDVLLNDEDQEENQDVKSKISGQDSSDPPGCYSEISSLGDGQAGTDDGYEGDSSDSEDDCHWLTELDNRRNLVPNFWLILEIDSNKVNIYFHCRFLDLASPEVDRYRQVQKTVISQIKGICRRVNQYLLLQSLHDTRMCDPLLEPESSDDYNWRVESTESSGSVPNQNSTSSMTPGQFRCPVVWEYPFCLHPRLKTGPGRSGLSRGIKALHGVLNRFSVNNRSNLFVYLENNENVFYLRLHEQTSDGKPLQNKLSESDERLVVSRSNSVASLAQTRGRNSTNDQLSANDTRPRVRSFGEKESDVLGKSGDSIVLMVHGISETGPEVRYELVQVLQNRLDDAVLEVLSVMLARNPMCKLTPTDVHFIQKPYRSPESVVQLSVQPHCLTHMHAFGHYLRQNILQFLYIPKYTDARAHYHFQDYSQPEGSSKRVAESDIYLYNQSHSSGSRGVACIALAVVSSQVGNITVNDSPTAGTLPLPFLEIGDFEKLVSSSVYSGKEHPEEPVPEVLIEFRIWKQGRVNLESLVQKLCAAVKHATWDLLTEYYFLPTVLMEPFSVHSGDDIVAENKANKETQTPTKVPQSSCKVNENIVIGTYESGEEGKLHKVYHTTLPYWFQFALEIGVPAIKKHVVMLQRKHPLPTMVKELQNLIRGYASDTNTRTFVLHDQQLLKPEVTKSKVLKIPSNLENNENVISTCGQREDEDLPIYVPWDFYREDHSTHKNSILVGRNFQQWKASFSKTVEPELLQPKDQKVLQRFNPLILESSFVPRQRLLLAKMQCDNIVLYIYNWSKERSEKLIKQTTILGTWLSSRSILLSNIIMQKMGITHHQPLRNYQQSEQASFQYYPITDMETLTRFPQALQADKDWPHSANRPQVGKVTSLTWDDMIGHLIRDAKPHHPPNISDPVVKAVYDLQELCRREKKSKEDLKRLNAMWQTRGTAPNIPVSLTTLNTFKQHSRLIHYCHTPLLFLPTWRLESAATRDHSLTPPPSILPSFIPESTQAVQGKSTPGKSGKRSVNAVSEWHQELCDLMLEEYKQYLQILGFNPIQVETPKKSDGEPTESQKGSCYLQKSMLGGVLLFEVHLAQPFFVVKLRVIECSRLQTKASSALTNQFTLSFVDACDKIKTNMHLHSFTYDFHLRCIHSYIAGTGQWSLQQGYHLTHFLDDFNKYYSKAPNYARNLVYSDTVTVGNLTTPARILYSYLLSHEKTYGMQVLGMSPDSQDTQDVDYVLVRLQSTPLVSYRDAQDMKHTDDFDVTLIVSRIEQPAQTEKTEITLKYYLMLTSKRELYPKRDVENKLGKFRTVYSVAKSSATSSHAESPSGSSPVSPVPPFLQRPTKIETIESSGEFNEDSTPEKNQEEIKEEDSTDMNDSLPPTPPPVPNSPLTQNPGVLNAASSSSSSTHLLQIRQESVNYLGYYSSHEQLMHQMMMSQAYAAREHIVNMVERGALHCKTHLLWNKLLENKSTMSYAEFMELRSLARVEPLSSLDQRLSPLISQPVVWYQTLSKVLQNKYQEHHKQFSTPDGNVTHHLILHPSYLQAFMLLTVDLHTSRGELYAVYRKPAEVVDSPVNTADIYSLVEGFVNACCFHLWMGLYNQ
ncbi:KICSTOR complex protein SZT2 isoform X2 [Orussus abietinus]|uniref:KICSTOR complex protein SZT2 isoform X2 n=1 Tax=Orussus abietinus TaxID=222816 RepID=UPI000625AD9F|nr:KICSTOR complex protein SZT2 isoform X2 [Orussus abietinus]